MAYNQHPLNTSGSHYNKPALFIILLIFIGIISFVVIRQLFPELSTSLGLNSEKQNTQNISITPNTSAVLSGQKNMTPPTDKNKNHSQNGGEKLPVMPNSKQNTSGVNCTQNDISAGLCKQ